MSTDNRSSKQRAIVLACILAGLAVVITAGLLLQEYGPGNMGRGMFAGAGVAILALLLAGWRQHRRPGSTTTLERAWTGRGDERDDSVLTRALAALGLCAPLVTAVATILLALEVPMLPVLAILNYSFLGIFFAAFTVINRRS